MDFVNFLSLIKQIASSDDAYFVVYAIATCLTTQLFKKLFVNKAQVDVLHKFDFATVLPFIVSGVISVVDVLAVRPVVTFNFATVVDIAVSCFAIGAFATAIFRLVSSLSGQSLASLMKDDVFGVFYSQLLYFGNVKKRLTDNSLTMKDFVAQVKLVASNAEKIYRSNDNVDTKRCKLAKLLAGIIDESSIETCINALNEALINYTSKE